MSEQRTPDEEARLGVCTNDLAVITDKERTYQGSWKKRGGVGAFMMLARMWDRLENMVQSPSLDSKFDILDAIGQDMSGNDGTALAVLRDLRRYAILIESEMILRSQNPYVARPIKPGTVIYGENGAVGVYDPTPTPDNILTPQSVKADDGSKLRHVKVCLCNGSPDCARCHPIKYERPLGLEIGSSITVIQGDIEITGTVVCIDNDTNRISVIPHSVKGV